MKKWYQSKTIWIAILQAIAGIFVAFSLEYPTAGWLLTAKSIVDILIRISTDKEIGL